LTATNELSDFLRSVEQRAYKRTLYAVRDEDAALDIVQDAMIRLAEHYGSHPAAEWPMLFQRILSNATMDWFRRRKVRQAVVVNAGDLADTTGTDGIDASEDLLATLQVLDERATADGPAETLQRRQLLQAIDDAVQALPSRQREAFLLRYWEELDVAETAALMGCTAGSVKQHTFRAVQALAQALRQRGVL
jgi:RNA polymerase sigma-70 factor (ECF subfamily)